MLYLLALMLNVPPLPPPPAEQMVAAEELLRIAPVPSDLEISERDRAAYSAIYPLTASGLDQSALQTTILKRTASHLAASPRFATDFNECLVRTIARAYDAPTLRNVAQIVTTSGGQALWHATLPEPVRQCYKETVPLFLQYTGFASALRWIVRVQPKGMLPRYDPSTDTLGALSSALSNFCGPSTLGALAEKSGRLGVKGDWANKKSNNAVFTCLFQSARLAEYDLPIIDKDGGFIEIIS